MQYVVLIYHGTEYGVGTPAWEALSDEEKQQIYADWAALRDIPGVTPGQPMSVPEHATTVRVQDGKALTVDGPYAAVKEALGGYFLLEADDLDAAIAVAAKVPAARTGGAIEIRPVEVSWK